MGSIKNNIATVLRYLQKGDQDTFKEVVYHYSGILMTVAKIYTRNKEDAEDVLQDAFISIYRNAQNFTGSEEKAFIAWMKKIVTNVALSKYRKMHYSKETYTLDTISPQFEEPLVLKQYEYEELMNAIYNLPLKYKRVVGLFALNGYSHKEIAEMLDIKPNTSRSLYSRATTMLYKALSPKKKIVLDEGSKKIYT
ncbi:MAG: RNA polymerase sigma factor [Bacteroidota bacterium]